MATATAQRTYKINVVTSATARQAVKDLNKSLNSVEKNAARTAKHTRNMASGISLMSVAAKAYIALNIGRAITGLSDQLTLTSARLALVTKETVGVTQAMDDLYAAAERSRVSVFAASELYNRLALATSNLGTTHGELIDVVTGLSNALRLSGASAQEAKALLIQLSQSITKGKLDGDEFRSVMENGAVVVRLLTKELKISRGELFAFSKAGKITTDVIINSVINGAKDLQTAVDTMPVTFTDAWTAVVNTTTIAIGKLAEEFGWLARKTREAAIGLSTLFDTTSEAAQRAAGEAQSEYRRLSAIIVDSLSEQRMLQAGGDTDSVRYRWLEREIGAARTSLSVMKELNRVAAETAASRGELDRALQSSTFVQTSPAAAHEVGKKAKVSLTPLQQFKKDAQDAQAEADRLGDKLLILDNLYFNKKIQESIYEKLKGDLLGVSTAAEEAIDPVEEFIDGIIKEQEEIDRLADYVHALTAAEMDGVISTDLLDKKMQELTGSTEEAADAAQTLSEAMKIAVADTVLDGIGNMTDAIVDFAVTGEGSARKMFASMASDIAKVTLQLVAMRALQSALGTSSLGGLLFPSEHGNVFQGGNVVPFAKGGVVNNPTIFPMARGTGLMGEAGPEAIMPLARDSKGDLGIKGGVTNVITINLPGVTDGAGFKRDAPQAINVAQREWARANRNQ